MLFWMTLLQKEESEKFFPDIIPDLLEYASAIQISYPNYGAVYDLKVNIA